MYYIFDKYKISATLPFSHPTKQCFTINVSAAELDFLNLFFFYFKLSMCMMNQSMTSLLYGANNRNINNISAP